jgi:bifunctional UDP-N-acetylglucosamine pyrophosphorylase/glucosamine-1-phosphate N-acetyltransferase
MNICAVIPAAGRGSRLGIEEPKLLAAVARNKTIWTIMRARLNGLVDHIHVVLSPSGINAFRADAGYSLSDSSVSLSIQHEPSGMGDAIFCGFPIWSKARIIVVIWGDQVHVSRETIKAGLRIHGGAPRRLVIPVVSLREPYVEYRFDSEGHLRMVLQTREGDYCEPGGLGDVGTFILSTGMIGEKWWQFRKVALTVNLPGKSISFLFLLFWRTEVGGLSKCALPTAWKRGELTLLTISLSFAIST